MEPTPAPPLRTSAGRLPGPEGVLLGHADATGDGWLTGCTVVLPPPGTVGSVAVAGGAPGTRETDALAPGTLVGTVDAVVLSGGSAYGLATADGVMRWCERQGRGFVVSPPDAPGPPVRVPIVPAAVVFDLGRGGDPAARPDARFGEAACEATTGLAAGGPAQGALEGRVGAGTGCRVGGGTAPGGVGVVGGPVPGSPHLIGAVVVANAAGAPTGAAVPTGGGDGPDDDGGPDGGGTGPAGSGAGLLNTTLVVVVTDAVLDVATAHRLAQAAHAGLARAVDPSHTVVDGDVVLALATGAGEPLRDPRDQVALEAAAARAVTQAFARAVA
ncbi:P1 family peptidase [Jannaschia sp. R86511]|uniref:P1 family peptidase n=1 Tax=Jannaschia sp. R86511 TaxID=3093853 RepID=UPI0036D24C56